MKTLRRSALFWGWLIGLVALTARPAEAQLSRADSAAVLLVAALDFEANDAPEVAAAIYRRIIERFGDTTAAADARERLARLVAEGRVGAPGAGATARRPGEPELPPPGQAKDDDAAGSGALELQIWSTLYGTWLGLAIPAAFGADGSEAYGAGLLLGAPAGFFAGRTAARRADFSMGQVRAITLGGSWGTWQGFGWREVFDLGVEEICPPETPGVCYESDEGGEEVFASMVIGGLAGIATGALIARRPVSSAAATGANFGSLWGTWIATALGVLADQEGDALLGTALVGGNAGLAAGALGTPALGWSRSRWRTVSIAGVLGGVAGLGIDLLVQPDDEKVAIGIPLITSVAGLVTGVMTSAPETAAASSSESAAAPAAGRAQPLTALVGWSDGAFELGTPLPTARREIAVTPLGVQRLTRLDFELMRARF